MQQVSKLHWLFPKFDTVSLKQQTFNCPWKAPLTLEPPVRAHPSSTRQQRHTPTGCSTSQPGSCNHCTRTARKAANTSKLKTGSRSDKSHAALHRRTTQTGLAQSLSLNGDNWVHIKQTTYFHMKPSAIGNSRWKQLFVTAWTLFSAKNYLHTNNGC